MTIANLPPADELASVREQLKALETREMELRNLLLEDPSARTGNSYLAEIKDTTQTRTDFKELRAMHPQLVSEYTFESPVKRVVLKRITEDGEIVSIRKAQP